MDDIEKLEFNLDLESFIKTISAREAGLLAMRYGLNDGVPKTFDEIARVYGITRDRARAYLIRLECKMKHPSCPMSEYFKQEPLELTGENWTSIAEEVRIEAEEQKAIKDLEAKEKKLAKAKRELVTLNSKIQEQQHTIHLLQEELKVS